MSAVVMTARFQPCADGSRLLVEYSPAQNRRGVILYVHPFAEEMNKSRHAIANTARALASRGWHVVTIDLLGCGDSSGDFADATWEAWIGDVVRAWTDLAQSMRMTPVLWGLRVGALLAVDALKRLPEAPDLLIWQPVLSGRTYLNQFLRLKVAAQMMGQDGASTGTKALRSELESGRSIEVAGYTLRPELALPLERTELAPSTNVPAHVFWCEVASRAGDVAVSPASAAGQERWRKAGADVHSLVVDGLSFWQTQEIAECPALTAATIDAIERVRA